MENALAWIGYIADWIGQFFPRWKIVDPTMGFIKYVRGKRVVAKGAGIWFWWPLTTTVDSYPVAIQFDDLRTQTLTTKDDQSIVVGGIISYAVNDIARLLPRTHSAVHLIRGKALAAIHIVCSRMTWDELKVGLQDGTLERAMRKEARRVLRAYGVVVKKVQLTDLAKTHVYKVMQSVSKDDSE